MTLELNRSPYFDDYNKEKGFYRILFKPGFSVQARELTQLQSSIQEQIRSFGNHVFKDGSLVLNGNSYIGNINYIIVNTSGNSYVEKNIITGTTSKAKAKIIKVEKVNSTQDKLFFVYLTGAEFQKLETVFSESGRSAIVSDSDIFGICKTYTIEDSVFYVDGFFVYCNQQLIVLPESGNNLKIGLDIKESIVDAEEDQSLLDQSQGSSNFAAPGADRLKIELSLNYYFFDPQNEENDEKITKFIEIARIENNELIKKVTQADYSELDNSLAKRTFDESGDYTVKAFSLQVKPHVYNDSSKLTLAVGPGKAYVKGYDFETTTTANVSLEKARDFISKNGQQFEVNFGDYILINAPTGGQNFDYSLNKQIDLLNGSTVVGSAVVRAITKESATVYRLYVHTVKFTGVSGIPNVTKVKSSTWEATLVTPQTYVKSTNKSSIVQLPHKPIRSLLTNGLSDTVYVAYKSFSGSVNGNSITITTGSNNQSFISNNINDYVVVNTSNGDIVAPTAVTGTGGSRTLTFATTNFNVSIYTYVSVSSAQQKNKALTNKTLTGLSFTTNKTSLSVADCYKLISVTAYSSAVNNSLPRIDVTGFFDFDNGQTDNLYDHGSIKLKSTFVIPANYDKIDVVFSYFSHSSNEGYFSVDSYIGSISYDDIPTYVSSDGTKFDLRDCVDFRPKREDSSTNIVGGLVATSNSLFTADYTYYIPRIDKLVITKERKFSIVKGISADNPTIPTDLPDAMTLYVIRIPAYTLNEKEVSFSYVDNRRYTMRDIGKIEKRVERLEYYTSLSLLEKQASDESIPSGIPGVDRFKNGILVDSFSGHSVGDVNNSDYSCSIEPETRTLRPRHSPTSVNYLISSISIAEQNGDLVHLPYTTEVLINQPFATRTVNLNPYLVFNWNGIVTLNPATDNWVDITTKPDVVVNLNGENDVYTTIVPNVNNPAQVGVRWNDWQTVNRGVTVADNISSSDKVSVATVDGRLLQTTDTTITNRQTTTVNETLFRTGIEISSSSISTVTRDLGSRIVDTSIVPFIRSRQIQYVARNLKPVTKLEAYFDGTNVTTYCTPAIELKVAAAPKTATKIRNFAQTKEATILLVKAGSVFTIHDIGEFFVSGDSVQFFVDGNWQNTQYTLTNSILYSEIESNENGDCAGIFDLPNNSNVKFRVGEKSFRLTDDPGQFATTAAETTYVAQGLSQSSERTIVATRIQSVSVNPTQDYRQTTTSNTNTLVTTTRTVKDITPPPPPPPPVLCGATQRGSGNKGNFTYVLEFGSGTGNCGVTYTAGAIPDRYTILYNGKVYTSGFVGNADYNENLRSLGFPNVSGPGTGQVIFDKETAFPTAALLIVDAPIDGTGWNFRIVCPGQAVLPPDSVSTALANANLNLNPISFVYDTVFGQGNASSVAGTSEGTLPSITNNDVIHTTSWNGNDRFPDDSAVYRLVSVTTNNNLLVANIPANTAANRERRKNQPINFTFSGQPGLVSGTYDVTSTWQYVSGADVASVGLQTLTITRQVRITVTNRRIQLFWVDPVAQTFFIDSALYPSGVFIDSIDLYFRKKSLSFPVTVQLRPVVNGYPSANIILPFGISVKDAADITVSNDGSVATNFKFENIVHLSPGEYSFVAIAETDEYEIYTSFLGEFSISNPDERVTRQPILGSMFKSQNASVWTPSQEEDVKFRLHKCVFDINNTGEVTFNADTATLLNGDIDYDLFYSFGESVDFADTNIDYSFNVGSGFVPYQLGSNYELSETKTLDSDNPSSLRFKAELKTSDRNITPIIDTNRLSAILVKNVVNNDSTNETNTFGGNAIAKYITRKVKLNPGFEAGDLRVALLANLPTDTGIKIYYKVSGVTDSTFDDNNYVEMVLDSASVYSETNYSEYKYKTTNGKAIESGEKFDTFAVKIVMLSSNSTKVPLIKDLRVIALDD